METSSKPCRSVLAVVIAIGLTVTIVATTDAQLPSIEGTYRLVSRTLADG
jgi:hypothetical protein